MPQDEKEVVDQGDEAPAPPEGDVFAQFSEATEFDSILAAFAELCREAQVGPGDYESVYPSIKARFTAWKPCSVWELLDSRAALPEYRSQSACRGRRVLVVGAGPVGLRMAVEAALLGARVDLVEKRGSFSRNNSLHLWPFLIADLRSLGAKKFYGKFATGSLDHICIRILQSILVKVCLLLGVCVHANVSFASLVEPTATTGWTVTTQPASCPVNKLEFDAVLAADGKKNSLPGFKLKEFRAKLALAITANFVNGNTQHENSIPEISGVSYLYRMDFFNELYEKHGIELENIVYYKSETHYFVMTAKKPSLLLKGVLKKDFNDPKQLLSPSNIDSTALKKYTVEAASYSTKGQLPLTFLKNHKGEDDVALFDFTSLFASENAARIVERKGRRILLCVAGDSLNEPFWPTGSGCGRGFLGAFDAAWMLKRFCEGAAPLELVEEREALFYLLPQTTPERLAKNLTGYTIDPKTRYPNLSELVPTGDISHLYDTDNPSAKPPSQQRQLTPAKVREANPPLKKAASVSGEFSQLGTKRSRSSENLSAIAELTPVRKVASPSTQTGSAAEQGSREVSPTPKSPSSIKKMFRAREKAALGSQKPPKTVKQESKKPEKKESEVKPKKKSVSPKPSRQEPVKRVPESPKSKQKGFQRFFERSRSKSPSPTPSSDDETEKTKQTKVKRVVESAKKSEDAQHRPTEHPLSVAKQAKASAASQPEPRSTEAPQRNKNETKRTLDTVQETAGTESVADIVKRLNPQQPATEQPAEKSKKKDKAKKEDKKEKMKEKEKQQPKGSKTESKKEKEGASKGRSFLSILKPKKSYDVNKASSRSKKSSSPKLKKKKKLESEKDKVQQLSEKPPLSLQQRIKRLEELGVGKADTDGLELVVSLEELRDLELSRGLNDPEGTCEGEETRVYVRSTSPAGQSEDGLESEESNRSRSSTPVYSSGTDEVRPGSRVSRASSGAATYGGTSSRGVSPAEGEWRLGSPSGGEEASEEELTREVDVPMGDAEGPAEDGEFVMERTQSVVDTVRQLEPLSAAYSYDQMMIMKQAEERKSKEFELAELHRQSAAESSSSPLWLARIIQGMGRCLEKLRKEQESILDTKTTLQIINTILSNVQLHPSDDTYRRVRVSSQQFNQKVWQFSDAGQFLARAGWVEIDDFIVLPMGQTVDNAKRVLEKHLNIVNQMLWSQQLELPDSPGVVNKMQGTSQQRHVARRHRTVTAAMIARRQSYSSRIVAESLKEVEEEQEAIEAELVRMNSAQSKDREFSPDHCDASEVSDKRGEEVRTMKAASAARSKWMERQRRESLQQRRDREYKLILESELYDLPPSTSSLQLPADSASSLASPSPAHSLSVTPDPVRSTSPSSPSPTQQDTTLDLGKEVEEKIESGGTSSTPDGTAQPADAQYSTPDSIRQDMMQYEKITLEAAAQVRQKWTET